MKRRSLIGGILALVAMGALARPPHGGSHSNVGSFTGTAAITESHDTVSASGTVSGGATGWQTLPVGAGGFVRGLIQASDGTLVGRTDTAGAYLYNSTSNTWNQLFNPTSMPSAWIATNFLAGMLGCYELAIAPSNTQIFYANFFSTIWKTTNQGGTWTQVGWGTHSSNANDNSAQIGQKMAVDPNNPNIVYTAALNGTLQVTSNGGTTWSVVSGVPTGATAPGINGIVFGPASNVISGVTQVIYVARQGTGVYTSTDGGSTWALTTGGPTTVQNAQLDASGNYWASGNGTGVYEYVPGTGWSHVTTGGGNGMQAIAINPLNANQMVGVDNAGWVTVSNNGGSTWTGQNSSTSLTSTDIPWLAPGSTETGGVVFITEGNSVFSAVNNGQLISSAGTGVWKMTVPTSGVTSTTPLVYADMSQGIENLVSNEIISPGSGQAVVGSWDRPVFFLTAGTYPSKFLPANTSGNLYQSYALDWASSDPTFVVSANQSHGGYSHNFGSTWVDFASQTPVSGSGYMGGVIAASTTTNIIWAGAGSAPYYTTDGGNTWTQISISGISSWSGFQPGFPNGTYRRICADRSTANTFYLEFVGHGVYKSTDGGATWTQQFSGTLPANSAYEENNPQIKAVPSNAGQLFYTSGINQFTGQTITSPTSDIYFFRSVNSGVTWTHVANVLGVNAFDFGPPNPSGGTYPSIFINGFVNQGSGYVYGYWRSDDNAITWNNIGTFAGPNGLSPAVSMAGDPSIFGQVYVANGGFNQGVSYSYYVP